MNPHLHLLKLGFSPHNILHLQLPHKQLMIKLGIILLHGLLNPLQLKRLKRRQIRLFQLSNQMNDSKDVFQLHVEELNVLEEGGD